MAIKSQMEIMRGIERADEIGGHLEDDVCQRTRSVPRAE
jgi:hypothetical protein